LAKQRDALEPLHDAGAQRFGDRDRRGRVHEWVQVLSFLCMGWLSFLLVLTVGRDVLLPATNIRAFGQDSEKQLAKARAAPGRIRTGSS
jgi:hypothetical protein